MPEEKVTQDQTICTQHVFVRGDTVVHWVPGPLIEASTQLGIVFDKENGNRDDHIGAPLHQPYQRFFGIRFRKDDQRHNRMAKNFGPPFERHEGVVRPNNSNETVGNKRDEPPILSQNL